MSVSAGLIVNQRLVSMLRYLDVVLVLIALAPALALGAPALGCAFGAGGWILQRGVAVADRHWIRKVSEPKRQLGANLFEGYGRIWLLAIVIVVAGLAGGREDGLTAALVICGAYSVAFVAKVLTGPDRRRALR